MTAYTLAELLRPATEGDFLARTFQKDFLHIPGKPDKLRGAFSWADLSRILEKHRLEPPLVMLRKDGKDIDPDEYLDRIRTPYENDLPIVNPAKLAALMRDGATLSLHEMHWRVD
ncbi:MAG: hypothetical protein J2P46_04740 [Zavarzinella sp.]|nr:hypothetical protein [Zavarzinella sp.]